MIDDDVVGPVVVALSNMEDAEEVTFSIVKLWKNEKGKWMTQLDDGQEEQFPDELEGHIFDHSLYTEAQLAKVFTKLYPGVKVYKGELSDSGKQIRLA